MNAMPLVLVALVVFVLAYRFYFSFVAAKVLAIKDSGPTPATRLFDGQNYYPMSKWVLFGHHFAAIAGAGPLVGPVLAAQFGFCPGFLWILIGAVVAGAVHDLVILTASVRRDGKSLAEIARREISRVSGVTASVAILIIITLALAGLGNVVVNALTRSSWGTFTIAATIPIAIFMGLWMFVFRKGRTGEATAIGVVLLTLAVVLGRYVPESPVAGWFTFSRETLTILLAVYGFGASVLPVWLLLSPRDYLSSIMKLGVVAMLAVGVIVVAPNLKMPAFTEFVHGGGPLIKGSGALFPYLFITIACGAVSGFHSLVSSGTTPKMIMSEAHLKPIAVGSMLAEGMVSILALIAASSLFPLDYFQINVSAAKFQAILPQLHAMGFTESNIQALSAQVNEEVAGRPGGAVSLAVGMAQIFSSIPGLAGLMAYWYHFAIMFEALFILTTIDAGTRIARFILQEAFGKFYAPFARAHWLPGNLVASFLVVLAWGYFIFTNNIDSIWPMFGAANQLLACIALVIGTSWIINRGRARYAWVTAVPMAFVGVTTLTAGWDNITGIFFPLLSSPDSAVRVQNAVNIFLTLLIMLCVLVILGDAVPRWWRAVRTRAVVVEELP